MQDRDHSRENTCVMVAASAWAVCMTRAVANCHAVVPRGFEYLLGVSAVVHRDPCTGLITAGASKDKDTQEAVVGYLRTISVSSSKLLLAAKALSADPNAPNVMNQLAAASRYICTCIGDRDTHSLYSAVGL